MSKILFVFFLFSNIENFNKYYKSEDGRLFCHYLMKKEIGYAIYVSPTIQNEVQDLAFGTRVQAIMLESLRAWFNHYLHSYQALFFISDSMEAITSLPESKGCLPFLLTERQSSFWERNKYIGIKALSSLNVYFEDSLPFHLLTILKGQTEDYKEKIKNRNERITQQIESRGGTYIFGAVTIGKQVYAECLKGGIKVLGFIDNDPHKQGKNLYNLPIAPPSILDHKKDVVILASGNHSYEIGQQLQRRGFQYVQNLSEFYFALNSRSQPEGSYHDDLCKNSIRYHGLYLRLADNLSRNVLEKLVEYRKSFDLVPLSGICDKGNPQWVPKDLFTRSAEHVFADGGAFDGDTALRFINANGDFYKAIHLFEVDPYIAQRAARRLEGYKRVYVHNVGLSNKRGRHLFSQTGLTDGHLVSADGIPVEIDSLDNAVEDPITFLKLDVEGAEEDAINGAMGHISRNSPMLAIAAYHRAEDIWSIPCQILRINSDYAFYLRHYTQVAYETVLYGLA